MEGSVFFLYLIAITIIGILLFNVLSRPQEKQVIYRTKQIRPKFETHWWGYGWRPWWRKYNGVPGMVPKPLIVDTKINKK